MNWKTNSNSRFEHQCGFGFEADRGRLLGSPVLRRLLDRPVKPQYSSLKEY
jgi:hypothetical protein